MNATAQQQLQDQTLTCRECGEPFTWTAGEQLFYRDNNLTNTPSRCRACRNNRSARPNHEDPVMRGTVKWFSAAKGYGWITPEDPNAPDVFVHFTGIMQKNGFISLVAEQRVEYNLVQRSKGPAATNVRVIEGNE